MAKAGVLHLMILVLISILLTPDGEAAELKKATLMPLWSTQAQFAGYYVALDKGIYARHGIDLTILKGGPSVSPSEHLQNGKADFAVLSLAAALQQNGAGNRLVNVAQIIQKSSMMLIARKTSGIRTPADFQGRKVGVWNGDLATNAFFTKYQVRVQQIPQSYTVNLFLRGGIDAVSAQWHNEYHTILNSGIKADELNIFFLDDHGIRFPEDGLYILERNYRKDPAFAASFAKASLEGWRYAFDHPDEALDIVIRTMKKEHLPANRLHQKWMLEKMRDQMKPRKNGGEMGQLSPSDYEAVGLALRTRGVITTVPGFEDFIGRHDAQQ